jgi:hypothetical protein
MGGFSESDLAVLTNTLNQDLSDYVGPNVELVVSPIDNAAACPIQLICLLLPTSDALTRSGDFGSHIIHRDMSSIFRAHAYLDLMAFCKPYPQDYMRVISGTGRGALAIFLASHESSFKLPSDCYTIEAYRVLGRTVERVSHVRLCPWWNESPP